MQDKELYQHLLVLCSPWALWNVLLNIADQGIVVSVEHPIDSKRGFAKGSQSL
jgi:hypothetical protein